MLMQIVLALVSLSVVLYYYLMRNYNYWESLGVKGPKPTFFFGTVRDVLCGKMYIGDYVMKVYNEYVNEPFFGIYIFQEPYLIINDLEIIKDILIRNFDVFPNRGFPIYEKPEPLDNQIVVLESRKWRPLRHKFSPTFSIAKLKEMIPILINCTDNFDKYLMEKIGDSKIGAIVECRDAVSRFVTDSVVACLFGLEANALSSEDSAFHKMGKTIFEVDYKIYLMEYVRKFAPALYTAISKFFITDQLTEFVVKVMRDTIDYRKKNNVEKHDIIEVLMAMRDYPDKIPEIESELNDTFIAVQFFSFFAAGFETTTSTMSNVLYELALNPEIQDKLRDEINGEIKRSGGYFEYDGITQLKYLNMVLNETLRMHPPIPNLDRCATSDHTFHFSSGKKVLKIKKGQHIFIPFYSIQRDPKYFRDPDTFDPKKFSDEAVKSRNAMAYLPFGDGPRNCIGKRFAVMLIKFGLVKILQNYKIDRCEETEVPYIKQPRAIFLAPKNGVKLRVTKLPKTLTQV